MTQQAQDLFENLAPMIGNTPLLEIHGTYQGRCLRVFAKAEYYNPTGSIKDRIAYGILKQAYETGAIRPGMPIAEATSGNTGIAFAAAGAALGHPVVIFMPDWMSRERIAMIQSYGAKVRLVSQAEGGFLGAIRLAEAYGKQEGAFLPRQFSNPENSRAHETTTGEEIRRQLTQMGLRADGVVAGVGTGGTIMGITRRLKAVWPSCRGFALEPKQSPMMSAGGPAGAHRIQGIGDDFVPDLIDRSELDGVILVDDGDAIRASQMLSRSLGIGVGISSGANLIGSILAARQLGGDPVIVTVFADDNKKYLSTDYAKEQPVQPGQITQDLVLTRVIVHR